MDETLNKQKEEEDRLRMEAEKEFTEKFEKNRRLSRTGHSNTSGREDSESGAETKKRTRSLKDEDLDIEDKRTKKLEDEEENGEEDEDELGDDPLENLGKLLRRLRGWSQMPSVVKLVRKSQAKLLDKIMNEFQEEILRAREGRAILETRVEERGKIMMESIREVVREECKGMGADQPMRQRGTYAEVANRKVIPKVTGVRGPVHPVPKRVIIRQENKESEEVKKTLKAMVKPAEIGLQVKRITKIRNGVILEAETEEGIEKLMKDEGLQKAGVKVEKPNSKKPMVMVYDVSAALKDEEVKEEVYRRNMGQSGIAEQAFQEEFEIKHRYKDRGGGKNAGNRNHLVVECSVRVRNWLRSRGRIFVEWESCRIKDYIDVPRCYKCQRYGHVAKLCNGDKTVCPHCSGDHEIKDCKKTGKEGARCINCVREGRTEVKHPANWKGCPGYEKAVKRYNEQIDYGL